MNSDKIATLIEALPYIKKFSGKSFVIKYGGSIMKNEKSRKAFIEDVVLMQLIGIRLIIVHGGGPKISAMLESVSIDSNFINGMRVTDKNTMDIVEMVLSGQVNKSITAELSQHGISAIGLSGRDSNLIEAQKKFLEKNGEKVDIGFVGEVTNVNTTLLNDLLEKKYLPVISPVGCDIDGNIYNINADYVAAAVSSALKTEKLILLTDVEGIYKDTNDPESLISEISKEEIKQNIEDGVIWGGMLPKMECSIQAIENGTNNVHLIDGRKEHSLLLEIFTDKGSGTMIKGGKSNV